MPKSQEILVGDTGFELPPSPGPDSGIGAKGRPSRGPAFGPLSTTLHHLHEEVVRARTKFPRNRHLLAALTEEVGELAQAMLQGRREAAAKEALQVACVAIRLLEEGDSDFDGDDAESQQP